MPHPPPFHRDRDPDGASETWRARYRQVAGQTTSLDFPTTPGGSRRAASGAVLAITPVTRRSIRLAHEGCQNSRRIRWYDQNQRLNSMRYTVILEQEADGGYVATVPALPGCVSQGDTHDEVMRNIREAADLYIEDCIAAGDPVPTEAGREYFELKTGTHQ